MDVDVDKRVLKMQSQSTRSVLRKKAEPCKVANLEAKVGK